MASDPTVAGFKLASGFDVVVDELLARGVTFETFEVSGVELPWNEQGVLRHTDRAAAWFKDPDGNVLVIGQDAMG